MLLVYRCVAGGAIDFRGGGYNYPLGAQVARGLQHIKGAFYIGVYVGVRGMVREWNADESGQVEDNIHPFHRGAHTVWIPDIPQEHVDIF